jgi:hypothetical protein
MRFRTSVPNGMVTTFIDVPAGVSPRRLSSLSFKRYVIALNSILDGVTRGLSCAGRVTRADRAGGYVPLIAAPSQRAF